MKKHIHIFTCFLLICCALTLNAQNPESTATETISEGREPESQTPDSITRIHTLDEIVVEGANHYTTATKSVYIPTSKEKESSYDVTSLLQRMSIPELSVSPFEGIKTVSGKDVKIFINYLRATGMDLEAISTKDVISVEYLDFPNDPRFQGADYVVNLIVKEYQYGGYTKVWNRTDWTDKAEVSTSLFQRLNYKKMTYDLFTNHSYSDITHTGTSSTESYRIPTGSGGINEFTRKQDFLDSKSISTSVPVVFRVSYQSDKVTIRNSIGYSFHYNPLSRNHGQLTISTLPDQLNEYNSYSNSKSNSVSWNGEFNFDLPKGWYLSQTNLFGYSYNNNNSSYTSGYQHTEFENNSLEKAYHYNGDIDLMKSFNSTHYININASGTINYNHVDYSGSAQMTEHYAAPSIWGNVSYSFNHPKMYLNIRGGLMWEGRRINGTKHYNTSPTFHLSGAYAYSSKNRTALSIQYVKAYATSSALAPVTIQSNEFMYLRGNPDLNSYPIITASLTHTFLPNNLFNLTGYINYTGFYNRITEAYFPMPEKNDAILRTYVQGGDYQNLSIGANIGFRYKDKLNITVKPSVSLYHKTGLYRNNYSPFSIVSHGSYYLNNFYISYYLESPKKIVYTDVESYSTGVLQHEFHVGYTKSGLNLSLSLCNPFRSSYNFRSSVLETPYYSSCSDSYSPKNHRALVFQISYLIGYGKKTNKDNEAKAMSGASSVVLQ